MQTQTQTRVTPWKHAELKSFSEMTDEAEVLALRTCVSIVLHVKQVQTQHKCGCAVVYLSVD